MKNNIIQTLKSKKFMFISAVIFLISLFTVLVKVLRLEYYIFHIIYNLDYLITRRIHIEELFKILAYSSIIILFAFILYKKINLKSHIQNSNKNKKEEIKYYSNKSKITTRIIALISAAFIISLFIFLLKFSRIHYMLYRLEDIAEDVFKFVIAASLIVFCKKLIEKL